TKVDGNGHGLSGAEFYLYTAPNDVTAAPEIASDATPLKSATSDANGVVNFGNMSAGRYYIIEHTAPDGYEPINSVYSMQFDGTGGQLKVWNAVTSTWENVANNEIVNIRSTANVTITKTVSGNMGDRSKAFSFTVTSTEPIGQPLADEYALSENGLTATFSLRHNDSVTLQKVPIGAVLTISETGADDYTMTVTPNAGEGALTSYTVTGTNDAITVENSKSATPDTGVFLDSLPYIVILACVVLIAILLLVRRRRRDDR
ncbi:MAG: SpaA isopeptide-forming pilin-related protein, partial [Aristaeellaceae bacterium]